VAHGDEQRDETAGAVRQLEVEWRPGRRVTACLEGPGGTAGPGILLAHGAGAGQGHPFVTGLRRRLAGAGFLTMTFDYPYAAAGRRAPDRLAPLDLLRPVVGRLPRARLIVVEGAGHSFGVGAVGDARSEAALDHLAEATLPWLAELRQPGGGR